MKVKLRYKKNNNYLTVGMGVLSVVLFLLCKFEWWVIPVFLGLFYFINSLEFEFSKKIPWVWTVIVVAVSSAFTMFSIQFMLLEWELFMRTSDEKLFLNALCCAIVTLLILIITNNSGLSCAISAVALLLFGFVNYFVYLFRGNEFSFADLKSAGTGLSVASKYNFELNDRCGYVILFTILMIAFYLKWKVSFESRLHMSIISVMIMILCGIIIALNSMDVSTETWEQKGSYKNGYLLNFVLQIRDSYVLPPSGYSKDEVEKLSRVYKEKDGSFSKADVKDPTIIVIMNESFADLSVIGEFETNLELTPYMNSLSENTTKGYALSSVYGAKTPNSEWEYMTGNSMAFLPDGSVVYQQYIDSNPTSIVSTLKNEGYTCVSMHPYYETGWSRNTIYPTLGYDESYFIDDFDQSKIMREYITDEELYDKIIDRYEKGKGNEKLFLMGITMQNHGGYGEEYENFEQYVYKIGESYTDANQYFQLVHESDLALRKLIGYFENIDEPVEIVFFGDHQPGLNSQFYPLLNGKGLAGLTEDELENLYKVPYFIWTNYDTPKEENQITSINYLSTLTLERANIDLPPYNQFLANMMEEIPAINSRGYYSKSLGRYIHVEDATGKEQLWINNYNILQYNGMFEKKKNTFFFPYLQE